LDDSEYVLTELENHVAWVTLNEPARLNPVNLDRIARINARIGDLSGRDDVRVIVITGAGRGFCSGADQKDEATRTAPLYAPGSGTLLDAAGGVWSLTAASQPVIAMVNGAAIGFGFELAIQADLVLAGASATFALPFAKLGTVSDTGAATWLLPRLVGHAAAADLLYTGRKISAEEAQALGVVYRVVPDDQLRAATQTFAEEIAAGKPAAVKALKRMLVHGRDHNAAAHLLLQFELFNRYRAGSPADRSDRM